jgi:hypothetical protein
MSFPPATEMFQFAGFASRTYGFSAGYPLLDGLPHSEIPGSTSARLYPGLFAACHVLHRLSVPRHPPNALTSTLDRKNPSLAETSSARNKPSREDTPEQRTDDARQMTRHHPPATANPPPSIHRKQLQPIGTTPTAESAFGSLPLHLSKITRAKDRCPPRKLIIPDRLSQKSGGFNPRSFCPPRACRSRGASAPLSRLATTDTSCRSRGGGGDRNRTDDLLLAKQALSQLSYTPKFFGRA